MERAIRSSRGPFRADQIRPGDPYELSDGHAVYPTYWAAPSSARIPT